MKKETYSNQRHLVYKSPDFDGYGRFLFSDEVERQYDLKKKNHVLSEIGLKREGEPYEIFSWTNPAHVQVYLSLLMGKCIRVTAIIQDLNYPDSCPRWIVYIANPYSISIPEIIPGSEYVDLDDNPVTPIHSHYYKPVVIYKDPHFNKETLVACFYSNRIEYLYCNRKESSECALKELGLRSYGGSYTERFSWRNPAHLQAYLSVLIGKCIFVTAIMEACDYGNGYPYWMIYIQDAQDADCDGEFFDDELDDYFE